MKCIVSLSGGRDSATCLGLAVDRYGAENVYAMGFEYGSTHPQELECAKKIAAYYGVPYQIITINPSIFAGSTCTMLKGSEKEIQKDKTYEQILAEKEGKVDTYVPFRNGLFSAYVAAKAESLVQQFDEDVVIMLGQHADDSGYYIDENGNEMLDESKAAYPDAVAKDTKIWMADWTQKNIQDLQVGEYIWSIDEHTLKLKKSKVLKVWNKGIKPVYKVAGNLHVSANHLMFKPTVRRQIVPYSALKRKDAKYSAFQQYSRFPYITNMEQYELGYLRGFYDGDGWITKISETNQRIYFCQKDRKVLEEIVTLLNTHAINNGTDITIYCRESDNNYIYNFGLHSTADTSKFFEKTAYSDDINYCLGYLAGIFIAEGNYQKAADGSSFISFCQSIKVNNDIVQQIDRCFEILKLKPNSWLDKSSCKNWLFKKLCEFPVLFGGTKRDKYLENLQNVTLYTAAHKVPIAKFSSDATVGEKECWDIMTEGGTFFADGILVHNCTVSFVRAFEEVVKVSSVGRVHYDAPFIKMHKWELLKIGMQLKKPVPYELCLSCYDPIIHEDGTFEECKRCATCLDVESNMEKALKAIAEENK